MSQDENLDDAQADERENPESDEEEFEDENVENSSDEHSTAEFMKNVKPLQEQMKKRRRRRIIFSVIFSVLLLGAAGLFGFKYLTREAPKDQTSESQQQISDEPETAPLESYESQALRLGFEYPENWQIDESEAGFLRVVTHAAEFNEPDGQSTEAKLVITISESENALSDFPDGQATAVSDSKKITYSSPSPVQRPETNLSFLAFSPEGALDAVYVTGDKSYMAGNYVPLVDVRSIQPTVVGRFYLCGESSCDYSSAETLGIDPAEWEENPVLIDAENVIRSLSIK